MYLAEHPALAVLEVLVHFDLPLEDFPDDYVLLRVGLPDDPPPVTAIPETTTQSAGDRWLLDCATAVLRVSSVIVPQAANFLLNPLHPAAMAATVERKEPFRFDPRLLRSN